MTDRVLSDSSRIEHNADKSATVQSGSESPLTGVRKAAQPNDRWKQLEPYFRGPQTTLSTPH